MACPIWRRLLAHLTRLAVSRARFKLGSRIEISRAMIPITTSNSTRVNPSGVKPLACILTRPGCRDPSHQYASYEAPLEMRHIQKRIGSDRTER